MRRPLALIAILAAVACMLAFACNGSTINEYCTGIPAGGCPGAGSMNCEDTAHCAAIYLNDSECNWHFIQTCPNFDPPPDAGSSDASDASPDAIVDAHLPDASFTLPLGAAGGTGCEDLENPDCSVETAAICGKYCCGCEDLYVCVDAGWSLWGACNEAGAIVPMSQ